MVEKCANCKYIDIPVDEGECKDCNNENNSKNWVYDKTLDEEWKMGKMIVTEKDGNMRLNKNNNRFEGNNQVDIKNKDPERYVDNLIWR